jgi:hypothetical protein
MKRVVEYIFAVDIVLWLFCVYSDLWWWMERSRWVMWEEIGKARCIYGTRRKLFMAGLSYCLLCCPQIMLFLNGLSEGMGSVQTLLFGQESMVLARPWKLTPSMQLSRPLPTLSAPAHPLQASQRCSPRPVKARDL